MKTTFRRLFTMIATLLLLCMVITGISFRFLMLSSMEAEKKKTLQANAEAIATLAKAYNTSGELEDNWDFRISLSLFTEIGDAEALICDTAGSIQLCSCDQFNCSHIGMRVDPAFLTQIESNGSAYQKGILPGIYTERRYLSGARIEAQSGSSVGYVIISAPMTQVVQFMRRSSELFLFTSIAVMMLALLAATFLSRSMVRPLKQVAEAARRFGRGEMDTRVEISENNDIEINDLASAFNTMADSLEKAETRRQEFIANVSHELKTPMTTIGGYIDGMLDGTIPPEKQQHYMQIVSGEVRRLSRLVRNMLDISRLQAKGIDEARKTRFDLGEAMGDVLITFEQKINAKHLQVDVDLPERSVWVRTDRDGITQVIYNLLDNAIKFCPERGALSLVLKEGSPAVVTVRNSGPTIPAEELPLLFERFHKADKSRSQDREGWGLGLYIAKTIVGASGGDIHAESENGITSFIFTLPTVR